MRPVTAHTQIGGNKNQNSKFPGLMSQVERAALDPIFYLHHGNIDRMWAAWNISGENNNPTNSKWLEGPAANGHRWEFVMPMPDGTDWVFTPEDVADIDKLGYTYEELDLTTPPTQLLPKRAEKALAHRLDKLGVSRLAATEMGNMETKRSDFELVGANAGTLPIKSSGARAKVRLEPEVRRKVSASLRGEAGSIPDQVYLRLENVQGTYEANILRIFVNEQAVETVSLFGLGPASLKDGEHGGGGLTFLMNITAIIDDLHLDGALEADSLDVTIQPDYAVPDAEKLSVERISVYRQSFS